MNPVNIVTPEPAKDPKTGFLVSLDNADVNLKSKESQFFDQVKKDLQGNVLNSPNTISPKFDLFNQGSVLLLLETGFANFSAGFIPDFQKYVQNPLYYKINNINAINLQISITLGGAPQGFSTIADTNYSVDMYFSCYLYGNQTKQPINFDGSFRQPAKLLSAKNSIYSH